MNQRAFDRAAIAIGMIGVLSPVFALSQGTNTNFVQVRDLGLFVLFGLGVVAVVGAATSTAWVVWTAAVVSGCAAVLQLAQFGRSHNWLGGNGSTFAVMATIALGLIVVMANRPSQTGSAHEARA